MSVVDELISDRRSEAIHDEVEFQLSTQIVRARANATFTAADYVIPPDRLLVALAKGLDAFESTHPEAKTRDWTQAVHRTLEELGKQASPGIEYLCTLTHKKSEFLLDGIWWNRLEVGVREHISLAMECEWAAYVADRSKAVEMVVEDFRKLLVVKSPLKLLVFCSQYSASDTELTSIQNGVWERLKQDLKQYGHHIEGEQYLFLDTAIAGCRKAWRFAVTASGYLREDELNVGDVDLHAGHCD